jgi:hypothetical protein
METFHNRRITSFAFIIITILAGVLLASCSPKTGAGPEADNAGRAAGDGLYVDGNIAVQNPLVRGNFVVFPLTAKKMKSIGDFITLDEAVETQAVAVTELDENSPQVDTLTVENRSDKPLFLLSGEIVYGGKQNRVIRHSMVLRPGQKMDVPVRCVEAGRWSSGKSDFTALKEVNAPAGVRQAAQQKQQSQQATWNQVEKNLKTLNKSSSTESLKEAVDDPDVQKEFKEYSENTLTALTENEQVVGIVVAVNGRIIGSDVFSSHELFKRYAEKLLNSYAMEALIRKGEKPAETPASVAQVRDYLARVKEGKQENVIDNGPCKVTRVVNGNQETLRLEMENLGDVHENTFETESPDDQSGPDEDPPIGNEEYYYPEPNGQQQQQQQGEQDAPPLAQK